MLRNDVPRNALRGKPSCEGHNVECCVHAALLALQIQISFAASPDGDESVSSGSYSSDVVADIHTKQAKPCAIREHDPGSCSPHEREVVQ